MAKTISLTDKLVNESTNHIKVDYQWFYDEVSKKRNTIVIEPVEKEIEDRTPGSQDRFVLLGDTCNALGWEKITHKEQRNKLAFFSDTLRKVHSIYPDEAYLLIYEAMKRIAKTEFIDPSHAFLSKKERNKAKKNKIIVRAQNIGKTDDAKKEASKQRRELRKQAKELGISTSELKAKLNEKVTA